VARSRSESSIPDNQHSSEFLGRYDVGSIIGREIVAELPDAGQEHEMRISSNTEIQQIADRLVSTMYRDHSLQCRTPQYLYYEVESSWSCCKHIFMLLTCQQNWLSLMKLC
jgi:hypothetical protein